MLKKFITYQVSLEFYKMGQSVSMPKHLKDQFDRASSSVCLNLAEGSARGTERDRQRFYRISFASLRECQSILELQNSKHEVDLLADRLGALLYRLCK